jgi:AcrR family transcriptional regulator
MNEAGLTHGGFYAHFPSRDALLAAAADQAGLESAENLLGAAACAKPGKELMAVVDAYLSDEEAIGRGFGCAIAAAGSDVPRQQEEVRQAVARRVREMVGLVERQVPHGGKAVHEKALAIAATMVGALVLARAVSNASLSKKIRVAARDLIGSASR